MITTKPATGWTREWPTLDGYYWTRDYPHSLNPILAHVSQGHVYEAGVKGLLDHLYVNVEWLGPITPADLEQLEALRDASAVALKWMDWWLDSEICECDEYGHVCGKTERKREADALRNALETTK